MITGVSTQAFRCLFFGRRSDSASDAGSTLHCRWRRVTIHSAVLNLINPTAVLVAAFILVPSVSAFPPSLSGIEVYGPYAFLAVGTALGLAFGRGRALFAMLTLAAAYVAFRFFLQSGQREHVAYAVFAAMCLFVPFNLGALSLLRERGTFNRHGLHRLSVIGVQILFTSWLALPGNVATRDLLYAQLIDPGLLVLTPVPQIGLAFMVVGLATSLTIGIMTRSSIDLGLAGATVAFGIAAHGITLTSVFPVFIAAGAGILAIAVLQDSFRMAFRDELTGLPSRRALNEQLAGLGRTYSVAMLDIDRFKGLNDHYGHDIGDQVLKMVATKLAQAGGGARAYRYGGEEFTVLFPGRSVDEALPCLEALREEIAAHGIRLRKAVRTHRAQADSRRHGTGDLGRLVSVTVSIGVAERNEHLITPEDVIRAADRALYRAKNRGRNQVAC
jgi:diguanylate cyclase (GGDEF)-like protein